MHEEDYAKQVLPVFIKASSLLVSSLELSEILPCAMEIIKDLLLQCEAASIMLIDEKSENLIFEVALGEKGQEVKKIPIAAGRGIAGKVALSRKSVIVNDVSTYKDFDRSFDEKTGFKTRGILCVPIQAKSKVIGVAEAINPLKKKDFDERDLYLLSLFSNQVALAIESARLHKKIVHQKRLEDELYFAHTVQQSFLPHKFPEGDDFSFYAVTSFAYSVGGDLYDVFRLGGREIGFAIGDVSGKGIPAALFMARTLSQLRTLSQKHAGSPDPLMILEELNSSVYADNMERMFVTLIYGIFFPEERKIVLSSAGHPYPFLYSKGDGKWNEVKLANQTPVGLIEKPEYRNTTIQLSQGDKIIFFTDGLSEAVDAKGDFFIPRVFSRLPVDSAGAAALGEAAMKELSAFMATPERVDDATVLVIDSR